MKIRIKNKSCVKQYAVVLKTSLIYTCVLSDDREKFSFLKKLKKFYINFELQIYWLIVISSNAGKASPLHPHVL